MPRKAWSEEELAVLRDVSRNCITLASQMHRLPGRTITAAKCQASKSGISLKGDAFWTTREVEILKRIWYGKESLKVALARELPHRTYNGARSEAARLGLTANFDGGRTGRNGYSWLLPSIERVLADGEMRTAALIAREVGVTERSVGQVLRLHRGRAFRVAGWTWPTDKWAACWSLGAEPDVPKPAPKGSRAATRAYQQRQRIRRHAGANVFASIAQQVAA